uniref:LOW QUALITY PROTEIN: carboxylesterase 4A n=1 Tax=Halichoerus grypus TaxID=9711 RepID=UPI001659EFBF|nr:LOW QUALITY PROTEIN: carboxylesterase 4A [Halichoerus grypus]
MYPNTRKQSKWLSFREDGLYLTVYRPRAPGDALLRLSIHLPARRPAQPLHRPAQASAFHARVMVWFPGGAFLVGSASTYDASELAAREKVVLVLRQHRLGILAFLSAGDTQARGNWALLDKVAAQRWVQKNIAAFGGDPGCVTLFGQSSWAMSISGLVSAVPGQTQHRLRSAMHECILHCTDACADMMKYRANFAHTGNPNVGKLTYWPQYNKEEKYLWMDFTMRVGVKLKEEKMAFRMRLHHHGGPEKQRHF